MNIADRKGSLAVGKDADIIVFDDDSFVPTTLVQGKIIHQS
jgi:N-acetylglucosamine-6-phosphate deacetylase